MSTLSTVALSFPSSKLLPTSIVSALKLVELHPLLLVDAVGLGSGALSIGALILIGFLRYRRLAAFKCPPWNNLLLGNAYPVSCFLDLCLYCNSFISVLIFIILSKWSRVRPKIFGSHTKTQNILIYPITNFVWNSYQLQAFNIKII